MLASPSALERKKDFRSLNIEFIEDFDLVHGQRMSPLQEIISQRRLSALFQPIMDLKNAEFLGFEGLIRGPAESPLHSPVKLFAEAEKQGLSLEVEMLSRQIVLEAFANLNLPGRLFLNISPETLTHPSFKNGQTLEFMRKLNIDPGRVVIEITENQPTYDFAAMRKALLHYRDMGFKTAIDDLGEGFSSLRLWSELRPDFIKIDMHFVQGVDRDPVKLQFLKSIQQIAVSCGTRVIAEGIETEGELRVVKDIGIAFGQGYLIARPGCTPPLQATVETRNITNLFSAPVVESGRNSPMTALKLVSYIEPVQPETLNEQVFERFINNPYLRILPVVKNGIPLGLIGRTRFLEQYAEPFRSGEVANRACAGAMLAEPLKVEKDMPIEALCQFIADADSRHFAEGFVITDNECYLGVASGQDLLREMTRMQQESARHANPLSRLPGSVPVNEQLDHLLQMNVPFTACYCDLDNFKVFNDSYGYQKGDELIQLLGRILNWTCDHELDFIGHIGGDEFVLLMQSHNWKARCAQALCSFEQAYPLLFKEEHLKIGGYLHTARDGRILFNSISSLSIGALPVLPGQYTSHHEVMAAMNDASKMAKKVPGNSLFVEQRTVPS
jgi:EAL domain-containing protein (putative c-di-GMP-specific phosphodiesterase class I)/GGDEF domain-containing protein